MEAEPVPVQCVWEDKELTSEALEERLQNEFISQGKAKLVLHLLLANNRLTYIPPSVFLLVNLQMLSFYNNPISLLPPDVVRLRELRVLDLMKCRLTTVPKLEMPWLHALFLKGNPGLPKELQVAPANIAATQELLSKIAALADEAPAAAATTTGGEASSTEPAA